MSFINTNNNRNPLRPVRTSPGRTSIDMGVRRQAARPTPTIPGAPVPRPSQRSLPSDRPHSARLPVSALGKSIPAPRPRQAAPPKGAIPKAARKKKWWRVITVKRAIFLIALLIVLAGGWALTKFLVNTTKVFGGDVFSVLTVSKLKGEDTGRVNILLAGNSADDPGHNGANLTDSIMIVSLDVRRHTAILLSVPRDLWVDIPGYGHSKINEAYADGESGHFSASGYPSGGMGLLQQTIHQTFGIPINYYALINYNALRDGVDAVGGIDVNIQSSDPRGLYDPSIDWTTHGAMVNLTNGVHHLGGQQALNFARARGDAYGSYGFPRSDFDRTEHQRMMLLALKTKLLSAGTLANPMTLGNLFDTLGKNVKTSFTLSEVRRLFDIGKQMDNKNMQSASLNNADGKNLLANYTSPTGQSALIPAAGLDDFSQIQSYIKRLTTNDPVAKENAAVVVLNGTGTMGLAATVRTALAAKGIRVVAIGDAQGSAATTTIIDASHGKNPATLKLLQGLYGTHTSTVNPYAGAYDAGLIVVLGKDRAAQ